MSSLSKLTLEPFCLTNSPQSSKWKSLLPRGLFPMLLPYSLSSLTLLGNKPAPVVTKVVTSLLSLYKVFLPDFLSPPPHFHIYLLFVFKFPCFLSMGNVCHTKYPEQRPSALQWQTLKLICYEDKQLSG